MNIRNILVPTDFSEAANHSLPHALTLANKFDAGITVLHVQVPYADDPGHPHYVFFNEDQYAEYAANRLQEILNRTGSFGRVSTQVVHAVSPSLGILRYLEQNPIDAVVIGTHGRSALKRFFLGTVAEKVVRHAICPVLTVACQRYNYRDNPSFQKILVPFDFSEYSVEAARKGWKLSQKYGAELQVVHIVTQEIQPQFQKFSRNRFRSHLPELATIADEALRQTLREEGLSDLRSHIEIGEENERASESIVRFARGYEADLLVLGRHGLTGIETVLLGSTTERVVRTAPCPVLTVHRTKTE